MSQQFLFQIERGDRPVPPRYAIAIQRATDGAVTVHDLRPDIFGEAPTEQAA
jgi:DNA-binding transcriptional regulator YdaS (Cro superfamily)